MLRAGGAEGGRDLCSCRLAACLIPDVAPRGGQSSPCLTLSPTGLPRGPSFDLGAGPPDTCRIPSVSQRQVWCWRAGSVPGPRPRSPGGFLPICASGAVAFAAGTAFAPGLRELAVIEAPLAEGSEPDRGCLSSPPCSQNENVFSVQPFLQTAFGVARWQPSLVPASSAGVSRRAAASSGPGPCSPQGAARRNRRPRTSPMQACHAVRTRGSRAFSWDRGSQDGGAAGTAPFLSSRLSDAIPPSPECAWALQNDGS